MADEWPSGVGGVQCGECYRTTICREFGVGQEEDGDTEWLCRPCYLGDDGSDESQPDASYASVTETDASAPSERSS